MSHRFFTVVAVVGLVVFCFGIAAADQAQEAKALVEKAVAMVQNEGKEKAFKAVSDRKGPFVKDDLYVWAGDFDKTTLVAHPYVTELMIGVDLKDFKDEKGNAVFVMLGKVAKDPGQGWVDYWNRRPSTGEVHPKRAYVLRVPGTTLYMGCGYFPK